MGKWDTVQLNSLFILKNDKSKQVKSSEYLDNGKFPVIDQSVNFICGFSDSQEKVRDSDLPLTVFGDHTRHVKFIDFPFVAGADGTQLLKSSGETTDKYFYYMVLFASARIANHGYDRHLKHLKEFYVKYPLSKKEQSTIATILTTIDQAIEKTEQLIAKYENIKTGLMQDLLTRGIDEQGNIRSEETHEFKDSVLGRIPVEWEVITLKEACERIQDGTHFSPETNADGEYMYITSKNIRFGELDLTNVEYITKEAHDGIYRRCSVQYGDVLLTKDGANTGNLSLNIIKEQISLLSSVAFLRGKRNVLRNDFLFQFLSSEKAQKKFKDQMSGNAITRITLEKINATQIAVPEIKEQERIVSFLKVFDETYFCEKDNLIKYRRLKISLMQDLLTGKVRIENLTIHK